MIAFYSPSTTKFANRFEALFSNSSMTFRFLLFTLGSSATVSFSTDSVRSLFVCFFFFFFGVVPV